MSVDYRIGDVNVDVVLSVVAGFSEDENFTTCDVAARVGVSEYRVRAAVSWLLKRGMIKPAGLKRVVSERSRYGYFVTLYRYVDRREDADFGALMGVFCRSYG